MERLSGTDALFLSTENPVTHQHLGGLFVLDPSGSPKFDYATMRARIAERLAGVPKFRWKLKEVPLHLDRPVWVDDADFHLDYHLRTIAVPAPGGRRELGDLVGELMSYQLDRRRPLWEAWFIDGVNDGRHVALLLKYHHCIMDGMTGASLSEQLYDFEPRLAPRPPVGVTPPTPSEPSDAELLLRGIASAVRTPLRVARYAGKTVARGQTTLSFLRSERKQDLPGLRVPDTLFNGLVGPRRRLVIASVALDDVRQLKRRLDVKVNDVVLAIVAGATRAYLRNHDALPIEPLVTAVPIATRVGDDGEGGGNQVATMMVSLPTNIDDPLERVRAVFRSTQAAKEMSQAVRAKTIQSVGEVAPPLLFAVASRAIWAWNVSRVLPVLGNMVVSNIPGPPFALCMAGARVRGIYAASVLLANVALNVTLLSYEDRIDFGITVDPDVVSDPWALADAIAPALAELLAAAGLGDPQPVADAFTTA